MTTPSKWDKEGSCAPASRDPDDNKGTRQAKFNLDGQIFVMKTAVVVRISHPLANANLGGTMDSLVKVRTAPARNGTHFEVPEQLTYAILVLKN